MVVILDDSSSPKSGWKKIQKWISKLIDIHSARTDVEKAPPNESRQNIEHCHKIGSEKKPYSGCGRREKQQEIEEWTQLRFCDLSGNSIRSRYSWSSCSRRREIQVLLIVQILCTIIPYLWISVEDAWQGSQVRHECWPPTLVLNLVVLYVVRWVGWKQWS